MRNRALKYTLALALVGAVITLLTAYVQRNTLRTTEQNLPYITLGDNIKMRITNAHLQLEELIAGNPNLTFDRDVILQLTRAKNILQGAYDGEETDIGYFEKTNDEDTRAILKESILGVEKIISTAQDRWKGRGQQQPVQTDSTGAPIINESAQQATIELERQFDIAFNEVHTILDRLEEHVKDMVDRDQSYLNYLSWISLILTIAAFVILCTILYRLQKAGDKMARENELQLQKQESEVTALSTFIEAISAGNYAVDLQMSGDTNLVKTLVAMRDKLRNNADDDRKRNWTTTGLAQIGEILRTTTNSTEELYDNIVKFVVKYTKSNQGGLFILNEDNEQDKHLELVACYAFERKKYLRKTVGIGDGLIGQCFLEGERIYLLEVPQEYVSITSGLGNANPNALLIVPLKINDKIFGVLELASFNRFAEYQIELVEKLAESIASTISTVRVNASTRVLLQRTQEQAEEMRAQEEEMRQNMEELEATQEEMRRKEKHIQAMLDTEKQRNEFSRQGRQVIMQLSKNKAIMSGDWAGATEKITQSVATQFNISRCSVWLFDDQENALRCEKLFRADRGVFEDGSVLLESDFPVYVRAARSEEPLVVKDVYTHQVTRAYGDAELKSSDVQSLIHVPFFHEGKVAGMLHCEQQHEQKEWTDDHIEFLNSAADLLTVTYNTSKMNNMLDTLSDAQETMQTIIDNLPRAVFWKDKDLRIKGCNRIFSNVAGVSSPQELIGKTDFDMPWREHANTYRADDVAVMESRKARIDQEERNVNSDGKVSWVLTSKVPVMNHLGEVVGVLGMFEDITDRKRREDDMETKLKELEQLKKLVEQRKN